MPAAWRIVSDRFRGAAFDGEGARLYGGRWNTPGNPMVYVASSRSLAALEMLVHLGSAVRSFTMRRYQVELPEACIEHLDMKRFDPVWLGPVIHPATQQLGDAWLQHRQSLILAVPSAIIPEELNYLINPRHRDAGNLNIADPEPFALDSRLVNPSNL